MHDLHIRAMRADEVSIAVDWAAAEGHSVTLRRLRPSDQRRLDIRPGIAIVPVG